MTQSRSDFQWRWVHITDDMQVQVGPGMFHTLVINQMGEGMTIQIFDGVGGGTLIGVVTTAFDQPRTLTYDLEFDTGLYIIAQYCDLTVTYI